MIKSAESSIRRRSHARPTTRRNNLTDRRSAGSGDLRRPSDVSRRDRFVICAARRKFSGSPPPRPREECVNILAFAGCVIYYRSRRGARRRSLPGRLMRLSSRRVPTRRLGRRPGDASKRPRDRSGSRETFDGSLRRKTPTTTTTGSRLNDVYPTRAIGSRVKRTVRGGLATTFVLGFFFP